MEPDMETLPALGTVTILCNVVGGVLNLKRVPFPGWCIPAALTFVVGPIGTGALLGWTAENIIHGILTGAASVGLHQGFTNAIQRGKTE